MERVNSKTEGRSKKYIYKNIFLVGSILHAGNAAEYFQERARKLVVFYFLGTLRKEKDFINIYQNGLLVEKKVLFTPRIPVAYHAFIYFWYIYSLIKYFNKNETIYIVTFHPLFIVFDRIIRVVRKIEIVFWIADVIPKPSSFGLKIYQNLIFYYHKRNRINFYLGDKLNKLMNGKLNSTAISQTVMWGIKLEGQLRRKTEYVGVKNRIVLGFVGVVRKGHGLDLAFKLLKKKRNIYLKILGECNSSLYEDYQRLIAKYDIREQVRFDNRYYTNAELLEELSECTVGIGLYNTSKNDPIYYTDPGKIKTYTQFGLPVVMTNTSEIVPYIKKFKAGEIIAPTVDSLYANVLQVKKNHSKYLEGVSAFNKYFEYKQYYDKSFIVLRS